MPLDKNISAAMSLVFKEALKPTFSPVRPILFRPNSNLIQGSKRSISGVAHTPLNAVNLGNQQPSSFSIPLKRGLMTMADPDSATSLIKRNSLIIALGTFQAVNAYLQYQSKTLDLDLENIKKLLIQETKKSGYTSKYKGNIQNLEIETIDNVRLTNGGIKIGTLENEDVVCVIKQGKIMVADKNEFEKSCRVDAEGKVSEILERSSSVKKAKTR